MKKRLPPSPPRRRPESKYLILLVGAPRFELGTPSPPDWCANRAALRSDRHRDYKFDGDWSQHVERHADEIAHASGYAEIDLLILMGLIGSPMFDVDPSLGPTI